MRNKIKYIIFYIGIAVIAEIVIINLAFSVNITDNLSEFVEVKGQNLIYIFGAILLAIAIFLASKMVSKIHIKSKKIKIGIIVTLFLMYLITQVLFINYRDAYPNHDQLVVYESAVDMFNGETDRIMNSAYMKKFPQQLVLAFAESIIFRLFNSTNVKIIQYFNAISNCFTVLAILLLANLITKKQQKNATLTLFSILTFLPLSLLSTFMYGDEISLAFSLFSVYFIMKYGTESKCKYAIISAILMALSYIFRMNSLIFIIAIIMYLLGKLSKVAAGTGIAHPLTIIKNKKIITMISIIILFLFICITPAKIITDVLQSQYKFDPKDKMPASQFMYMGMSESSRCYGWYVMISGYDYNMSQAETEKLYKPAINDRIKYLMTNPLYAIKFYTIKTASMWSENTNASIYYNQSFNFKQKEDLNKDTEILKKKPIVSFYMKALYLLIFPTVLIALLTNNKKISNEILLLIIILIGGFAFQTLWEAKSRYIIPYVVCIIPLMAIPINFRKRNKSKDELN